MKLCVLVCLILGVAVSLVSSRALINQRGDPFAAEERCLLKLQLDRQEMMDVVDQLNTSEENEKYGDFFVCLWKKRGVMQEDGSIDPEGLRRSITQILFSTPVRSENEETLLKVVDELTEHCKDVQGKTQEHTGIKLKNCLMQTAYAEEKL